MLLSYLALLLYLFFSFAMAQSEEQLVWMKNLMALARQYGEELRGTKEEKRPLAAERPEAVEDVQAVSLEEENMGGDTDDQVSSQ